MTEVNRFVSEKVQEMAKTSARWMETHNQYQKAKKEIVELERKLMGLNHEHCGLRTELLEFADHAATHAQLALESIPQDELRFRYPSTFIPKPEIYGPTLSSSQIERAATPAPSSTAVHRDEEYPR